MKTIGAPRSAFKKTAKGSRFSRATPSRATTGEEEREAQRHSAGRSSSLRPITEARHELLERAGAASPYGSAALPLERTKGFRGQAKSMAKRAKEAS